MLSYISSDSFINYSKQSTQPFTLSELSKSHQSVKFWAWLSHIAFANTTVCLMLTMFWYFRILEIDIQVHLLRSRTSSQELKSVDACKGCHDIVFRYNDISLMCVIYATMLWFKSSQQVSPMQSLTHSPVGWGRELKDIIKPLTVNLWFSAVIPEITQGTNSCKRQISVLVLGVCKL